VNIPPSSSGDTGDKINAINAAYSQTGVYARLEAAQVVGSAAIAGGTMDVTTDYITINGYTIPSSGTITVTANDGTGSLRNAINEISDKTGVKATLGSAGELVLTATDASNEFTVGYAGNGATYASIATTSAGTTIAPTGTDIGGRIRLYSDSPYTVAEGVAGQLAAAGITAGTYGIDKNATVDNLNVATFGAAQEAIVMVDNALRQVTAARSKLGAISNRLDNTVSNLEIASENLTSAESQIRDADFATETANMTRAQILQQSGVAVLAQANMTPQYALKLLQ